MPQTAPSPGAFQAKTLAITGRMASMSRVEAIARIEVAGGTYVEKFDETTNILVVGMEGWPLSRDGRLTHSLERAEELQKKNSAIEILGEDQFLDRVGLGNQDGVRRLYTIEQLERILQVPRATLRIWVRTGLVRAKKTVHRLCYFDFEQVASAKVLNELSHRGVTPTQIKQSLEQLRTWFPGAERSLAQLGMLEQSGKLLVRLGNGQLADGAGQLFFNFQADAEATEPKGPHIRRDWLESALQHEEAGDLERAADDYQQALLASGPTAEVCFNLGNVLYGLGRKDAAAQRFHQAVELDSEYVESWNNLGNTLAELSLTEQAVRAYRRALAIEFNYADAHFNLAEALEQLGEIDDARRHWEEYLRLDPNSAWARRVRERLSADDATE